MWQSLVEGRPRRAGGSINSMGFLSVPRTGLPGFGRHRKPSSKELQMLTTGSPGAGGGGGNGLKGEGAGMLGIYYKGTENFRENF